MVIKSTGNFFFRFSESTETCHDDYWTLLDSAAYSGTKAMLEAVFATINDKLENDEVMQLGSSS